MTDDTGARPPSSQRNAAPLVMALSASHGRAL